MEIEFIVGVILLSVIGITFLLFSIRAILEIVWGKQNKKRNKFFGGGKL